MTNIVKHSLFCMYIQTRLNCLQIAHALTEPDKQLFCGVKFQFPEYFNLASNRFKPVMYPDVSVAWCKMNTSTDWKERKKNKSREEIFYQMKVFLVRSVVGSVFL